MSFEIQESQSASADRGDDGYTYQEFIHTFFPHKDNKKSSGSVPSLPPFDKEVFLEILDEIRAKARFERWKQERDARIKNTGLLMDEQED